MGCPAAFVLLPKVRLFRKIPQRYFIYRRLFEVFLVLDKNLL